MASPTTLLVPKGVLEQFRLLTLSVTPGAVALVARLPASAPSGRYVESWMLTPEEREVWTTLTLTRGRDMTSRSRSSHFPGER